MSVSLHSLQRSLSQMTLGVVNDRQAKLDELAETRLTEGEQQFQIPISGLAKQGAVWVDVDLDFNFHFYNATGQRDSPYTKPQVSHSVVIDGQSPDDPSAAPVIVSVCVDWRPHVDDREVVTGAKVWVGVHSPTPDQRRFKGYLHITFQGYGARTEPEDGDI